MLLWKCFFSLSILFSLVFVFGDDEQVPPEERLMLLAEQYNLTITNLENEQIPSVVSHGFLDSLETVLKKLAVQRKLPVEGIRLSNVHSSNLSESLQNIQAHGEAKIKDGYYAPGGWIIDFDYSYQQSISSMRDFDVTEIRSRRFGFTFGRWVHDDEDWTVVPGSKLRITASGYLYFGFKNFNIKTDTYDLNVLWDATTKTYEAWWE